MNKVHIKQNAWNMVKNTVGNKNIALVFMNKELKQNIPKYLKISKIRIKNRTRKEIKTKF